MSIGLATGRRIAAISSATASLDRGFVRPALELLVRQPLADSVRGARAKVGEDQRVFQLVKLRLVELGLGDDPGDIFGQPLGGFAEAAENAVGPAFGAHASRPSTIRVGVTVTIVPAGVPGASCTRAKFGAWPVPSRSASTASGVPTSEVQPAARTAATAARKFGGAGLDRRRAALAASARQECRGGANRGRRGRGPRQVRAMIERLAACAASSSVGNPAIRSAPMAMSGRRRAQALGKASASRRKWRRFIRLRIRSSPCWSERWTCGITRGSPAISSNSKGSISIPSSEDSRSRSKARERLEDRRDQLAQRRGIGQIMPPAGQIDPGQHHFARAGIEMPLDFAQHRRDRQRPARAAALRDHAEGAGMVAAVLHRDEGAGVACDKLRVSGPSGATFQARGSSLAALAISPSTSGIAGNRLAFDFGSAAVTSSRASGRALRARRIAWRVWRTASAVTAQELTTTRSSSPASSRAGLAFGEVEPAAERNHFHAHAPKSALSKLPRKLSVAGPVMRMRSVRGPFDLQGRRRADGP